MTTEPHEDHTIDRETTRTPRTLVPKAGSFGRSLWLLTTIIVVLGVACFIMAHRYHMTSQHLIHSQGIAIVATVIIFLSIVMVFFAAVRTLQEMRHVHDELKATRDMLGQQILHRSSELERKTSQLEREIEERKRVQEELAASEQRYRAFVENATDIIYRTDPMGFFTFVNPVAARIMGRP